MAEIFSLLRTVGLRDWGPSGFVNKPLHEWPEQLRVYSNGNNSAYLRVSKGKIIEKGAAQENYDSKKPLYALWPEVAKHVRLGVGIMYFGALDNQISLRQANTAQATPVTPGAAQSAIATHYLGEGEGVRLECVTNIPPDLYSQFMGCVQKRVPIQILDELTAYLSLIEGNSTLVEEGYQFVVVITEHMAYSILYNGHILVSVGESNFRQGEVFDPPQYQTLAADAIAVLGRAANSVGADQIVQVAVWDVTARIAEEDWRIQLENQFKEAFPCAQLVTKTPSDLLPSDISTDEMAEMLQLTSFPLPLFAFLTAK